MHPLEDIKFLAQSANRVRALELFSASAPDRRELKEELGVSTATVNRILDDFEAREWIAPVDDTTRRYRATPSGALMSAAFGSLLDDTVRARALATVLRWLPAEDLPFDPIRLSDATITLPGRGDPIAPVHRVVERMRNAARVRLVPVGYVAESLRANRDAVVEDGQSFEAVFKEEILDCIAADPTATDHLSDLLEAGCGVYQHTGGVPYGVAEVDGQYAIGLVDDLGAAQALIETDDEVVGAWVRSLFETYRDASERLDPSAWTERPARALGV